jgi:hypothetical protein
MHQKKSKKVRSISTAVYQNSQDKAKAALREIFISLK